MAFKASCTTETMPLPVGQDITSPKIRLARLLPGPRDAPILLKYSVYTLNEAPPYIAWASLDESFIYESKGLSDSPAPSFETILRHLRRPETAIDMWTEQICIDVNSEQEKATHLELLRTIYESAVETFIWAGDDHAPEDSSFDVYLRPGDTKTTEHAFDFAVSLAETRLSDIPQLLCARYPPTKIHSWSYLFRILCRPFWRSLALLRTNYATSLHHISVQCGSTRIALSTLQEAARRIRTFFPPLDFIYSAKPSGLNKEALLDSDLFVLCSCVRFGVDPVRVAARIYAHVQPATEQERHARFLAMIGAFYDEYLLDNRLDMIVKDFSFLKVYDKDPARFAQDLISSHHELLPVSLAWEGPVVHPPRAEDQAPFVHSTIDRRFFIRLVEIAPASTLDQPIQCGLVDVPKAKAPDFRFATNNTFLRKAPDTSNFHNVQFPISTRLSMSILVNCQAFIVPQIQEVFLRLLRDSTQVTYVFLWNICMFTSEANMENRDGIANYVSVKNFMKEVGKAREIDMYAVLEKAGKERTRQDLESLGLPKGISWDEWLLRLSD